MGLELASYKIRIRERHVRAVPRTDADGSPFGGPGVDVRGAEADAILTAAAPITRWLDALEPGVAVRSISVRLSPLRVLVSVDSITTLDPRPRALRFEPPFADEIRSAGAAAETLIVLACVAALERRARLTARA